MIRDKASFTSVPLETVSRFTGRMFMDSASNMAATSIAVALSLRGRVMFLIDVVVCVSGSAESDSDSEELSSKEGNEEH